MADTVASPLLRMLSDRLSSLIYDTWSLKSLQLTLAEIQTLVLDAENRSEEDEALKRWLTEIKDIAYEADDLLDEIHLVEADKISSLIPLPQFLCRFKLDRKMKAIMERLDALLERRMKFQMAVPAFIPDNSTEGSINVKVPHRETRSSIDESKIFGRTDDKEALLKELVSDSEMQFKIIPIVGMGGLGKTTLAQLLYNDERVCTRFETRYWVCVSQVFDVRMIGKAIVETKMETASRLLMNTEETVDTIVKDELRGKKFLIVLDDVWNEDHDKWNVLKRWFSVGIRGSAVIVTSRSVKVAYAALLGTSMPYNLKPLSDEDGWLLFKSVAFNSMDEELENNKICEIGKKLVTKCKGLPLAIRTLAGSMSFKKEESEWLRVNDDDVWNLFESSVLPALQLSYKHLPSHLKQCFAYCSIFPKDHMIEKEQLIQLWIAEGFVQPSEGSKSLEDIGNDFFLELLQRSFFVEVQKDDYGDIVRCRMHELLHDLAQFVARLGCSIVESGSLQNVSEEVRYSSLVYDSAQQSTILGSLHKARKLRTLLLFARNLEKIPEYFLKLRRLRALDLSGSGIQKLSKSVSKLIHLRYLNLSRTHIETLPSSICELRSLDTLELIECYNLQELPKSICELAKLRCLDIQSCCSLSHMPARIGKLKLLQKLPLFILSNADGCGYINELQELDLRGKLELKNLMYVQSAEDALGAQLFKKRNLRSLELSWGHGSTMTAEESLAVLENLKPPLDLKVLLIADYKGETYPSWIMDSLLPNLVSVSLVNCSCYKLPPLGHLPNLKYLYVKGMREVEVIDSEFYGGDGTSTTTKAFPSLKQLELYDMPKLKEWRSFEMNEEHSLGEESSSSYKPEEAFPCLELLTIRGCSQLRRLSLLPRLKNLALWNCNEEILLSLENLTSLSSLVINEFKKPLTLPLGNLKSLTKMTIYDCDHLLDQFEDGMQCFSLLKHLRILYCDNLRSLPTGLKHLTSLQKLDIIECHELAHLPDVMHNLDSLEELVIDGCPMLNSLPNTISSLTRLQKLVIRRCLKLNEQFRSEKSEEWSKIRHIPEIDVEQYMTEEDSHSEP